MTESRGLLTSPFGEYPLTGSSAYLDKNPEIEDPLPWIYVQFRPDGTELSFLALLDTGAHYCILNSSVADEIGEQLFAERVGRAELRTANGLIRGELYIYRLTLIAEEGKPLGFEATVFVSPDWHGQCFIGYTGGLDRLCFAINPRDNRFYFGPLG